MTWSDGDATHRQRTLTYSLTALLMALNDSSRRGSSRKGPLSNCMLTGKPSLNRGKTQLRPNTTTFLISSTTMLRVDTKSNGLVIRRLTAIRHGNNHQKWAR
ncbi:hypothetical protein CLIM01_15122 [Colletotrichum limetticola]|uniref:Uncharacterized protein n=1 Tax=Colletotrichum limetticola TaxID=1209924 RepID=A0ABQ9P6N2_9PEZI|nr:hypothetical protein CLIM01_15122 [Colletotrichum limetticola]